MKKVWYIGFYDSDMCSPRRKSEGNIAGTVYMNGLINSLKCMNYHVSVVSVQVASTPGLYRQEYIVNDELLDYYFLPYLSVRIGNRLVGGKTIVVALKHFIERNVSKNDIIISYHSLVYKDILSKLHKKIGYKWIPEINEIYCLSREKYANPTFLETEVKMFEDGDGFIFANDTLAKKYANKKPFVVLYGNYEVEMEEKQLPDDVVNITYTGIINDDRGVFRIIDAMSLLPKKYYLYILGFGDRGDMDKLQASIQEMNRKLGSKRVFFCGTKVGREYSEFLLDKHIGVSLISQNQEIFNNAFPGKILSYMGHSLYVLSSTCDSILYSELGEYLYFCDNEPESIAEAIKGIPVSETCDLGKALTKIKKKFESELASMISGL